MKKVEVSLASAYRLLNPGAVVLVSVGDGERDNLFSVTWNMPVRKEPATIAVLSGKGHHSYGFIERTGELVVNVPDRSIVDAVLGCGSTSGRDGLDKFARFGLTREPAARVRPPLVAEAVASLECRVTQVVDMGASALLVAQILRATAAEEHFREGRWQLNRGLELIHHLGGASFALSSEEILGQMHR